MVAGRLFRASLFALVVPVAVITLQAQGPGALQDRGVPSLHAEPPMLGIHWSRGEAKLSRPRGSNPNMVWHNGAVMPTTAVTAIFWGSSWANASFVGDKIAGIDSWYEGVNGSAYAVTSDEYAGSNGTVGSAISYTGHIVDTSTVPSTVSSLTTPTFNEVCKKIQSPIASGYYPVYVDRARGGAGFCAYHSYGTCNNVPVQFAFFFNLDGDPGCDPQDTTTTHTQGLAALANVSGHEISEARSDPRNGGWYDTSGAENGDKCAWTFNSPTLLFTNNTEWKIQGNWSNAAYNAGSGYANSSGQKGCIDGGN